MASQSTGSYSKIQQIHSLSFMSNAAFGLTFQNHDALQRFVLEVVSGTISNPEAQQFIGSDWSLVWGPVVFSNQPNAKKVVADNTMALLYSPSQNLYTVAIAGTNINSLYGWFEEDFKVSEVVKWKDVVPSSVPILDIGSGISEGTHIGLTALLGMRDSNQKTLIESLRVHLENAPAGAEVSASGHSLGGALSPAMALYLKDTIKDWDPGKKVSTVSAYPTAGPTAGNKAFAKQAAKQLDAYKSLYNVIDVVPHAWQSDTLAQIPALYPQITQPSGDKPYNPIVGALSVGAVVNTYKLKTATGIPVKHTYTQIKPWDSLPGKFDDAIDQKIVKKLKYLGLLIPKELKEYVPYLVNFARFLAQLGYQHTTAYDFLLKIEGFMAAYKKVLEALTPVGQSLEQAHMDAIGHEIAHVSGIESLENAQAMESEESMN